MMTSGVTRASGVCLNRQTTRRVVVTRATANTPQEHKVRTANARSSERRGRRGKGRQDKPCVSTSFMFDPSLSLSLSRAPRMRISLSLSLCLSIFFFFFADLTRRVSAPARQVESRRAFARNAALVAAAAVLSVAKVPAPALAEEAEIPEKLKKKVGDMSPHGPVTSSLSLSVSLSLPHADSANNAILPFRRSAPTTPPPSSASSKERADGGERVSGAGVEWARVRSREPHARTLSLPSGSPRCCY